MRSVIFGLGAGVFALGVAISPIPGPGGIPVMLAGLYLMLRSSRWARKLYLRAAVRWPRVIGPIDRILRRRRHAARSATPQ